MRIVTLLRLVFTFFLVFTTATVLAQSVYIPDPVFRDYLDTVYPNCMSNGNLDTQCADVLNETELYVDGLGISDLTGAEHFVNLQVLDCSSNLLTSLTLLPSTLEDLRCSANDLTQLPVLPNGLIHLRAGGNQLTQIPTLPQSLHNLSVYSNNLTLLPALPPSLETLTCDGNNLTELPELPAGLGSLDCGENELSELPKLPETLNSLWAPHNNISCLPILPEGINYVVIGGNDDLHCVPNKPENMETVGFLNTYFLSLPICWANNVGGCPIYSNVSGISYYDQNLNCSPESGEVRLANRVVESSTGEYTLTDLDGRYSFHLDGGYYEIWQNPYNWLWDVPCPSAPYQVNLLTSTDSVGGLDFGNQAIEDCPWLWVDVAPTTHRPCFSTGSYHVDYCNNGTLDQSNAYVELTFPPEIIPTGSSIPWLNLGGGVYSFDVGDLNVGECGSFYVTDSVSCEAEVGETVCVTAEIFPVSPCLDGDPDWDNASIVVNGGCNGSTIDFEVKNIGSGNMDSPSAYRLYEDDILIEEGNIAALTASQSYIMSVASTGMTYRLEVDQRDGHPGASLPRSTVETCGPTPHSLGFVMTTTENDFDDFVEIACTELSAAFDPNDKQVIPSGYGGENYVSVVDSLLEYRIRFQNTGNDTAFTVVVVDTLPSVELNPGTFISGASSHPYTVMMYDNGIVSWRFENILLPDSATNKPASHGFVKFKIKTRPGLAVGTVINNSAAIYFDYNDPIITNTSFVTIKEEQTVTGLKDVNKEAGLSIYPNPTTGELFLSVASNISVVSICDMTGREVLRRPFAQQLDISELSAGNYILSVITDNGVLREKVVLK